MRSLTALVIVLMLSTPLEASEKWLHIAVAGSSAFDAVTTLHALKQPGLVEANPVLRYVGVVPSKAIGTGVQLWAIHRLWKSGHRKAATWAAIGSTIGCVALGARNLTLSRR